MNSLETLTEAIIKGRRKEAVPLTQEAIDKKADPDSINATLRNLLNGPQSCFAMVGPTGDKHRNFLVKSLNRWIA